MAARRSARRAPAHRRRCPTPAARRRWPRSCARPVSPWTAAGGCRNRRRTAPSVGAPLRSCSRHFTRPEASPGEAAVAARGCRWRSARGRARGLGARSSAGRHAPCVPWPSSVMSTGSPSSHAWAPGSGLWYAGQDLDQRGLARPVVADEGMDLTGAHVEVDVVERFGPREGLGHPRHPQQRSVPVFDDARPGSAWWRHAMASTQSLGSDLVPHVEPLLGQPR